MISDGTETRTFESQQLVSRADTSCHGEQIQAEEVQPVLKAHLRSLTEAVTAADGVPTEQLDDSVSKVNQPSPVPQSLTQKKRAFSSETCRRCRTQYR